MKIGKTFTFDAAHRLPGKAIYGKCDNLHGHTYILEVTVESDLLRPEGWVMNFTQLKDIVKVNILDVHDHSFLNDFYPLPTAEIMAMDFAETIKRKCPDHITKVTVKLWETPTSYAYSECE